MWEERNMDLLSFVNIPIAFPVVFYMSRKQDQKLLLHLPFFMFRTLHDLNVFY